VVHVLAVRKRMKTFYIATAIYLCGSLLLFGLMYLMGAARRKAFVGMFGEQAQFEDLEEEQAVEWRDVHESRFDSGFWRFVALAYMLYHYPGLIVSALFGRNSLHPALMFMASAVIWIGALFLILRPRITSE
jgi:hypothetical protein